MVLPRQVELRRGGDAVHLEPQVFSLLRLIRNSDPVVAKTELLDEVWGERYVTDSALTSRIKTQRGAVGDDGNQQRIIATVHGVGRRFVAQVAEFGRERVTDRTQHIRYCVSPDGESAQLLDIAVSRAPSPLPRRSATSPGGAAAWRGAPGSAG